MRIAYTANPNRATNVPITIQHADGQATVKLNERQPPDIDKCSVRRQVQFGREAIVTISNAGTDGYVIADAVQLVP